VNATVMQKIAMFSNAPLRRVFSMHDRESIYTIPEEMRQEGLDREVLSLLTLHDRVDVSQEDRAREKWTGFVKQLTSPRKRRITIGLTGKYAALRDAYASIDKALEHCSAHLNTVIEIRWIDTTDITDENVATRLRTGVDGGVDAVILPGGFGKRGVEGKISCVRHCRENGVPYLGLCLGMQVAVIEHARNVCGMERASSTEFDTPDFKTPYPVITDLPEQRRIEGMGGTMRLGAQDVSLRPGTLAHFLYGQRPLIRERFRHRYEVNPQFVQQLESQGMVFSGKHSRQNIMQILELPQTVHPYFIAGQFHPELTSRPVRPSPMFMGLVAAGLRQKYGQAAADDPAVARWLRTPASSEAANAPAGVKQTA
jgi:CTP synthase